MCWLCMCSIVLVYDLLGKLILIFEVSECWSIVYKVSIADASSALLARSCLLQCDCVLCIPRDHM